MTYVLPLDGVGMKDIARVGGKNASLGEMITHLSSLGVRVPGGFATTAEAFKRFLEQDNLNFKINGLLEKLDVSDIAALESTGAQIRQWIMQTPLMGDFVETVTQAYLEMQSDDHVDACVAVRSSATAEDLPEASFAGQQETFLNIRGIDNLLLAIRKVFTSLFTNRAIAYRVHHHFNHADVLLSAGIQRMVRSDKGSSGVIFTVDTESGFKEAIFITSAYGLGELVVQGEINPDEFYVHKPTLEAGFKPVIRKVLGSKLEKMIFTEETEPGKTVKKESVDILSRRVFSISNEQILQLARYAIEIEKHYKRPMDIEWGLDGDDGQLYILQARPETIASHRDAQILERYSLNVSNQKPLISGRSVGHKIGAGIARVVNSLDDIHSVQEGDVLVTDMTDPDWEPVMKIASAIVTNRGGRTCHAAIIAREMGVPAVVGCGDATDAIENGSEVTVSCAEGDTGNVYSGMLDFDVERIDIAKMPDIPVKVMMNVANPERAFDCASLPNRGIGLARLEFIINTNIGFHPRALLDPKLMPEDIQKQIEEETACYDSPRQFYVDKLAEGMATLAAAVYPEPTIVRLSDFKSNEYANLIGGQNFEPEEENPMLGFRGASRYASSQFRDCFELECEAVKKARLEMGLSNIQIMIPFVRTVEEARAVIEVLAENGLQRGIDGLKIQMMCEIPSNAVLAEQFLELFDGFSIGSNDMTQLTLGLDRDSGIVSDEFDERNEAVKYMLHLAIQACLRLKKYIGICGQGPSDYPDFAAWLLEEGIESISLNPDTVVETWLYLAKQLK